MREACPDALQGGLLSWHVPKTCRPAACRIALQMGKGRPDLHRPCGRGAHRHHGCRPASGIGGFRGRVAGGGKCRDSPRMRPGSRWPVVGCQTGHRRTSGSSAPNYRRAANASCAGRRIDGGPGLASGLPRSPWGRAMRALHAGLWSHTKSPCCQDGLVCRLSVSRRVVFSNCPRYGYLATLRVMALAVCRQSPHLPALIAHFRACTQVRISLDLLPPQRSRVGASL